MLGDMKSMPPSELWGAVCTVLKGEMSAIGYKTWIATLSVVRELRDGSHPVMVLEAPTSFNRQFLESRYAALISNALSQAAGRAYGVKFVTAEDRQYLQDQPEAQAASDNALPLNPKYTFDAFVVGNSNRFAHAASLAVAEAPAMSYNPLFVYGGVGLGKTHLLHAIGHYIREQYPRFKVIYITIESFTNEFIHAIQTNSNDAFRARYRNVDVLMIDDIGVDTYSDERFYSYRRSVHRKEPLILKTTTVLKICNGDMLGAHQDL
jgi:chromosomal replication initiator protein